MNIHIVTEDINIQDFINRLNESFKQRSNERIPYSPMIADKLKSQNFTKLFACYLDNVMVGGLCIKECKEKKYDIVKISNVWTDVNYQKRGIASQLLDFCYQYAKDKNANYIQLNVADCYKPAVSLYLKKGYKKLLIYANSPKTYYFIRMIKEVEPFVFPRFKRYVSYTKSVIAFCLLYKKDSTPTLLNRIIYGRKK